VSGAKKELDVSWYKEQILPRLQDKVMRRTGTREVRQRVCSGLAGDVLEIGFGTGLNMPYYPLEVTRIFAVEPSRVCMQLAEDRIARGGIPVELAGLNGEHLELPSASFDSILSTWTLCTIPKIDEALTEMRRVLKPGGTFRFVEHGLASDNRTALWQRRIEPLQRKIAGGCHLTRDIPGYLNRAGFHIENLNRYYFQGEPKPFGYTFEGVASVR
jgi:ubiquinone/menaquinone biosynthesis C-methylase UbiE